MAQTPSNMLPLGTKAPEFSLLDTVSNKTLSFNDLKGIHGTIVMFICNHCPFVKHVNSELAKLAKDYKSKGINCIAISSNDAKNYPQDAPDKMKANAIEQAFIFPYLYDQTQEIAKKYDAACTPDFYIFDKESKLVYRGQLDDSRPGNNIPVTGSDMRHALDCLLNDKENSNPQKPSIGCNIKWK
ncbi:thioredoxin family protein [Corallibacter vietnamensis]|uniref:Thioredoxin family protein n=1 Tax=Corallibacter vietnamensis TaxID=904130 RepID=A0ABP7H7L6_9FLAO